VDYKFPDNNTGNPAFIGMYGGTFTAYQFESFGLARDATIEIGANGTFIVETQYSAVTENDGNRYNIGNLILEGAIYASSGLDLVVDDLGGGAVQITAAAKLPTKVDIEYLAGTNEIRLDWSGTGFNPSLTYIVETSPDLQPGNWTNVASAVGLREFTETMASRAFYRVRIQVP
jgi:hypothetical protein